MRESTEGVSRSRAPKARVVKNPTTGNLGGGASCAANAF